MKSQYIIDIFLFLFSSSEVCEDVCTKNETVFKLFIKQNYFNESLFSLLEILTPSVLRSIWLREILNDAKVQLNLTWSMKDMLRFQLQSYFCPSSQTFQPKSEYAVFSPSLHILCVQPKHIQLVLIRPGQTLKNLHQWSKAGGQTSLAKLTKHFCKITYRFIKLPVIISTWMRSKTHLCACWCAFQTQAKSK